jgi:hypothetical protein
MNKNKKSVAKLVAQATHTGDGEIWKTQSDIKQFLK